MVMDDFEKWARIQNKEWDEERKKEILEILEKKMSSRDLAKIKLCWKVGSIPPKELLNEALIQIYDEMSEKIHRVERERKREYAKTKKFMKETEKLQSKPLRYVIQSANKWEELQNAEEEKKKIEKELSHKKRLRSWKKRRDKREEEKKNEKEANNENRMVL